MGSPARACLRIVAYLAMTVPLLPVQALALALRLPLATKLPVIYHRLVCRILGIRVSVRGTLAPARPLLVAANHSSYLDIEVLGSVVPGSFVAKAEIAGWPFFGWLAKLQRSVFIERRSSKAREHKDEIEKRLIEGDVLILFPEGTSDDGNRLLPFRSALFSVAERRIEGGALVVQPVSLAYTRLDGMPMGRSFRPFFAWYGDMALAPHLWRMLGMGVLTAEVIFHEPVTIDRFGSRKAMAEHCWRVVSEGVASLLAGRPQRHPVPVAPAAPERTGLAASGAATM
ncbi:MAG: 1-acyl-sn-glycerol-3-phosphate acyltransferase [Rhodospirillales bacterium]|jgi:1-acyl-sn-glycerol-3-phosphate acyltransferase|nr:1-acyl-sn-glycerol-3-phosphate acyltransferase [Rhodospirillales bacterium]